MQVSNTVQPKTNCSMLVVNSKMNSRTPGSNWTSCRRQVSHSKTTSLRRSYSTKCYSKLRKMSNSKIHMNSAADVISGHM